MRGSDRMTFNLSEVTAIYLLLVNIVSFMLYGIDKYKAEHHKWRIRERTLILSAWIGGALGAFLGMKVFHHKTLHTSFRFLVPCALIVWILFLAWLSGQGVIVMG
jgi:uncharacterized membrane protein YsdA (DUF1294 family)